MDAERKRELKKLGKQIVEKRSAELKEALAKTNPAPFASDEYIANEIAVRHKSRSLRQNVRRRCSEEVRRDFIVQPCEFEPTGRYPGGAKEDYWECRRCGDFLPSVPVPTQCRCGNLRYGLVRRDGLIRLEAYRGVLGKPTVSGATPLRFLAGPHGDDDIVLDVEDCAFFRLVRLIPKAGTNDAGCADATSAKRRVKPWWRFW